MKALLAILAASLALPALALIYLVSDNPFEFSVQDCEPPRIDHWFDVVRHGCLDPVYVLQFIGIYGVLLFLCGAVALGGLRLLRRRQRRPSS